MADEDEESRTMQDAVSTLNDEPTEIEAPRVGGVDDGVVWTGGSNLTPSEEEPDDTMCYRLKKPLKEKMRQHEQLKKGIESERHLEIEATADTKNSVSVIGWVMEISCLMLMRGFDTVFRMCDLDQETGILSNEVFICEMWGQVVMAKLMVWIEHLNNTVGDSHDKLNLKLSGFALRASLGPNLLQRVNSLIGGRASGPEVFMTAIHQIKFMTATVVRSLCNKLGDMKLKKIPGENVATLGEQVNSTVTQIEASGQRIEDLKQLATRPFTTGTHETFRSHAQSIYTQVLNGTCTMTTTAIVVNCIAMHHSLVQSSDHEPGNAGKEDSDSKIHALLMAMTAKVNRLESAQSQPASNSGGTVDRVRKCFRCQSTEHLIRDCPQPDTAAGNAGGSNQPKKPMAEWRMLDPGPNGPFEKMHDGILCKWCGKCRCGKGLWMMGVRAHLTAEHCSLKDQVTTPQTTPTTQTPQGKLAVTWTDPLEVDFG